MYRITLSALFLFATFNLPAQKFGHFSSEFVVKKMPGYQEAQREIETLSRTWMEEIKDRYIKIGQLENKLEAEKVLLTPAMIKEREDEIQSKLKEAIDDQYEKFGPNGLFFLKQKELIRPELEKVFEAAGRVCKKHNLDYIFDKSSELIMVYTNPVHDYTDFILEELGLGDPNDKIR